MRDLHALCTDENGNQSVPGYQSSRLSAVRPFGGKALSSRSTMRAQASLLLFVLTSVVACYQRVGFIKADRRRLRNWALRHPDSKVGPMLRTPRILEIAFRLILLLLCAGVALGQQCPTTDATLPVNPLAYPKHGGKPPHPFWQPTRISANNLFRMVFLPFSTTTHINSHRTTPLQRRHQPHKLSLVMGSAGMLHGNQRVTTRPLASGGSLRRSRVKQSQAEVT